MSECDEVVTGAAIMEESLEEDEPDGGLYQDETRSLIVEAWINVLTADPLFGRDNVVIEPDRLVSIEIPTWQAEIQKFWRSRKP